MNKKVDVLKFAETHAKCWSDELFTGTNIFLGKSLFIVTNSKLILHNLPLRIHSYKKGAWQSILNHLLKADLKLFIFQVKKEDIPDYLPKFMKELHLPFKDPRFNTKHFECRDEFNNLRITKYSEPAYLILDLNKKILAVFSSNPNFLTSLSFFHTKTLYDLALKRQNWYGFHCAGLAKKERGILFPAKKKSGKSTIALTLLKEGFNLLSDDLTYIKQVSDNLFLLSTPPMGVGLRKSSFIFFPELKKIITGKKINSIEFNESFYFDPEQIFPKCRITKCELHTIVFPIINASNTLIKKLPKKEAELRLMENLRSTGQYRLEELKEVRNMLGNLVEKTKCYELFVDNNMNSLVEVINNLLEGENDNNNIQFK